MATDVVDDGDTDASDRNHSSSNVNEIERSLISDDNHRDTNDENEHTNGLSVVNSQNSMECWRLNYQEAAIYLKEGEHNEHFTTHPKSQDALPAYILVHNVWFYVMDFLAAILIMGLALVEKPAVDQFKLSELIHGSLELFGLTIIAIGLGLKMRWLGMKEFVTHKRTAIKTIVLVVMYCEAIVVIARQASHFRITRAFRPFFLIDCHYCGGVRRVLRQIFQSLLPILDVMLLLFYFMIIFTILGFFIFTKIDPRNFGSILDSFTSLFILMTTANFPDVMMPALNENRWAVCFFVVFLILELYFLMNLLLAVVYDTFTGVEKDKFKALLLHKRKAAFKAFKLLCTRRHPGKVTFTHFQGLLKYYCPSSRTQDVLLAFKMLNTADTELLTLSEFQDIYEVVHLKWHLRRDDNSLWFESLKYPFNKPFRLLQWLVTRNLFNYTIYAVLFINGVVFVYKTIIVSNISNSSEIDKVLSAISWYDWVFMGIYTAEIILKVLGLGPTAYLNSGWNVFDFVVTLVAGLGITIESKGSTLYYLVILRPIRLLRLFKIKKRYRDVFGTFYVLLGRMLSVGVVLIVMYYFYAIIGMECFSTLDLRNCCKNTTYEPFFSNSSDAGSEFYFYLNNFKDILNSYVTLFELTVVNNWHVIMYGIVDATNDWSRIYFIMFYLSSLVVVTIIVTFILEAFVFRMQYGLRNSQADNEFVSSIKTMMDLSVSELDRFYSTEASDNVQLALLQTMLRNAPERKLTYIGSRKRTKADLSRTMYADEILEWVREQDETQRKELRQFLFRQLSRNPSHQSLQTAVHLTSEEGALEGRQLQMFLAENIPDRFKVYEDRASNGRPYWELGEGRDETPPTRRKPDIPFTIVGTAMGGEASCSDSKMVGEDGEDEVLLKA